MESSWTEIWAFYIKHFMTLNISENRCCKKQQRVTGAFVSSVLSSPGDFTFAHSGNAIREKITLFKSVLETPILTGFSHCIGDHNSAHLNTPPLRSLLPPPADHDASVFTFGRKIGPGPGLQRHSPDRQRASWGPTPAGAWPHRCLLLWAGTAHPGSAGWPVRQSNVQQRCGSRATWTRALVHDGTGTRRDSVYVLLRGFQEIRSRGRLLPFLKIRQTVRPCLSFLFL